MGDDGWAVHGARPGSSASMYSDSRVDEHNGFTQQSMNRTYNKPNKYNPRGKSPSPEPWRGGGTSSRSSTATTPHGQNYFLSKSKSNTNDTLFSGPKHNGAGDFSSQKHNGSGNVSSQKHNGSGGNVSSQKHNGSGDWECRGKKGISTGERPQTPTARKPAMSPSPRAPSPGRRNYYGKTWNKRNESYVDELLFGPKPEEANFKAPWSQDKKQTYVFDATDYKALEIKKQLQNAAKNSKNKSNKGPTKPDSERVDHIERALRSQLAVHGEKPRPQSRAGDSGSGSQRSSTGKKGPMFKESYVDEMLFGSKPQEPDFPAPWEDNKKRTIHAFDGTNSTVTIHHENGSFAGSRPGSRAGSRRGSTGSTTTLRPAWR